MHDPDPKGALSRKVEAGFPSRQRLRVCAEIMLNQGGLEPSRLARNATFPNRPSDAKPTQSALEENPGFLERRCNSLGLRKMDYGSGSSR
jgi:hypothetical protein